MYWSTRQHKVHKPNYTSFSTTSFLLCLRLQFETGTRSKYDTMNENIAHPFTPTATGLKGDVFEPHPDERIMTRIYEAGCDNLSYLDGVRIIEYSGDYVNRCCKEIWRSILRPYFMTNCWSSPSAHLVHIFHRLHVLPNLRHRLCLRVSRHLQFI